MSISSNFTSVFTSDIPLYITKIDNGSNPTDLNRLFDQSINNLTLNSIHSNEKKFTSDSQTESSANSFTRNHYIGQRDNTKKKRVKRIDAPRISEGRDRKNGFNKCQDNIIKGMLVDLHQDKETISNVSQISRRMLKIIMTNESLKKTFGCNLTRSKLSNRISYGFNLKKGAKKAFDKWFKDPSAYQTNLKEN